MAAVMVTINMHVIHTVLFIIIIIYFGDFAHSVCSILTALFTFCVTVLWLSKIGCFNWFGKSVIYV